jgi:hypothetical protein
MLISHEVLTDPRRDQSVVPDEQDAADRGDQPGQRIGGDAVRDDV